jgi:hypothetical protein
MSHEDRLEAIKRQIAALLSLSHEGSGASEAEAATAAAMASRLMLKYALTEEQIAAATGAGKELYEQREIEYSVQGKGASYLHAQIKLMGAIARHTFCKTIYQTGKEGRANNKGWIIGQASQIDLALTMYARLMPQVLKMGQAAYWRYREDALVDGYDEDEIAGERAWRRNHFQGAATAIDNRLHAERKAAEQSAAPATRVERSLVTVDGGDLAVAESDVLAGETEGAQITALVLVKDAELKEAVDKYFPKDSLGSMRRTQAHKKDGYWEGHRDGSAIELHDRKALDGEEQRKLAAPEGDDDDETESEGDE